MNERGTWDDKSGYRARCEQIAREDRNRARFVAICLLIWACVMMFGCADKGPLIAPSLGAAVKQSVAIKKNVTTARSDINEVLKDNAIIARPDLTADLRDADTQLIAANNTIDMQGAELASDQKEIDAVAAQGNAYKAQLDATVPKHKRDMWAILVAYLLGSFICAYGPLLFKAYPALIFFPDWLEGTVLAFAGVIVGSGLVGLAILFGVL